MSKLRDAFQSFEEGEISKADLIEFLGSFDYTPDNYESPSDVFVAIDQDDWIEPPAEDSYLEMLGLAGAHLPNDLEAIEDAVEAFDEANP